MEGKRRRCDEWKRAEVLNVDVVKSYACVVTLALIYNYVRLYIEKYEVE